MNPNPKHPDDSVEEVEEVLSQFDETDLDPTDAGTETEQGSNDMPENVIKWLPVATTPAGMAQLKAARQRGRPRTIEKAPTTRDLQFHQRMSEEKARYVEADPVVTAAKECADSVDFLRGIKLEIAREAAALRFQRVQNEQLGRDTAQISTRRIEALNKVASIEFDIKKLGADMIDLRGERFQRVFKLWFEMVANAAKNIMQPEQFDLFLNQLETTFDGWEDSASQVMAKK